MKGYKIIIAIIILIASLVILFDKLFTPQPIQIVLQSGEEIATQNSDYFTMAETLLLVVCSFMIGGTALYLYYNSDKINLIRPEKVEQEKHKHILPLLKDGEKQVYHALVENKGEMLQNKLVLKLNISKVKVTRILSSMERKKLIVKERRGLTNNIRLE
jgi:uncharacterized membrane protein